VEPSALARFVRDVLGCGCPEEILRSITVDRGHLVPGLDVEVTRLDVGGRLLVYVVPAAAAQPVPAGGSGGRGRRRRARQRTPSTDFDSSSPPTARPRSSGCARCAGGLRAARRAGHLHVVSAAKLFLWADVNLDRIAPGRPTRAES
jgi:hypothetical protein